METTLELPVRCFYRPEIRTSSDEKRTTIKFTTDQVDRHRTIVNPDGIDFSHYLNNPVVLWNHGEDPQRGSLPVAKTVSIQRQGNAHLAEIEWYNDDFSQNVMRMMKEGYLNMASMSWIPLETSERNVEDSRVLVYDSSEMTEFSIVHIGSNRGSEVVHRDFSPAAILEAQNKLIQAVERLEARLDTTLVVDGQTPAESRQDEGHGVTPHLAPTDSDDAGTAGASASEVPEAHDEQPAAPADRAQPKPKGIPLSELLRIIDDRTDRMLGRK